MIPTLTLELPSPPNSTPIGGALEVGIVPAASGASQSILAGSSVAGSSVTFSGLNGLAAYTPAGGWDTRGAKQQNITRYGRGNEDMKWRKIR
jgi:hypothetical protein